MKKNLILISLDTVRADVGYSGKFATVEKLRRDGVTFQNTISSSPLTPVSHASVLTGLQPYQHGIRHLFKEKVKKNCETIAQTLSKKGWQTAAIVSCPGMNKWYGFGKGFKLYDDEIPCLADGSDPLQTVDVKKRGTALKRANSVVDRATKWLEKNKKDPFFLFLHFFDAHWPYEAPESFGGDNCYEEEVAFSDHYLGQFIETLKEKGLYEDSLIVCFSDHGEDLEGLYPNDKAGKRFGHPEEFGHGCLLYDQTQKVILIVKDKKIPANTSCESQVRLVDIAPTILDLLDEEYDSKRFDGTSLVPIASGTATKNLLAYSETFYPEEQNLATNNKYPNAKNKIAYRIDNRYKIISSADEKEYYDLQQDPNEQHDLWRTK